ncbi:hypothetical protein OSTOST_23811 [Ostertagia ostertagi]
MFTVPMVRLHKEKTLPISEDNRPLIMLTSSTSVKRMQRKRGFPDWRSSLRINCSG